MKDFAGKVAVVTGGAGGIGRAMVDRFTAEGMKAVIADIDARLVDQATGELRSQGHDVIGVVTDVTEPESLERLRDATLEAFGGVHCCATTRASARARPGSSGSTTSTTGAGRST